MYMLRSVLIDVKIRRTYYQNGINIINLELITNN